MRNGIGRDTARRLDRRRGSQLLSRPDRAQQDPAHVDSSTNSETVTESPEVMMRDWRSRRRGLKAAKTREEKEPTPRDVIASEAKQSMPPHKERKNDIASSQVLLAMSDGHDSALSQARGPPEVA